MLFPLYKLTGAPGVTLFPPQVRRVSPEVQNVVQGSSVKLECRADGNPAAAISWSRKQGHLPSGAQSEEVRSERQMYVTLLCTILGYKLEDDIKDS